MINSFVAKDWLDSQTDKCRTFADYDSWKRLIFERFELLVARAYKMQTQHFLQNEICVHMKRCSFG